MSENERTSIANDPLNVDQFTEIWPTQCHRLTVAVQIRIHYKCMCRQLSGSVGMSHGRHRHTYHSTPTYHLPNKSCKSPHWPIYSFRFYRHHNAAHISIGCRIVIHNRPECKTSFDDMWPDTVSISSNFCYHLWAFRGMCDKCAWNMLKSLSASAKIENISDDKYSNTISRCT